MHYQEQKKESLAKTDNRFITSMELLHRLNKYKWIYLVLLTICFGGSFVLFKYKILKYSATATFFMSDPVVTSIATSEIKQIDFINQLENVNRVYQLVRSTEVLDHLIKKFNLLQHYAIDTTAEFYHEDAIDILYKRIEVKKNPSNSISVTVQDSYRYMAAELANEAVAYVDDLNKKLLRGKINQKVSIYSSMITDLQKESEMPTAKADSLLLEVNKVMSKMDVRSDKSPMMSELQQELNKLVYQLNSSTTELMRTQRFYSFLLHATEKDNLPTFTIIEEAQASHNSLVPMAAALAAGITLLLFSLIVFFQFLFMRYADHIRIFIRR